MDSAAPIISSYGGLDYELRAKPLCIRCTRSNEALWIHWRSAARLVTHAFEEKPSFKGGDGGTNPLSTGFRMCKTEGAVMSRPTDQFSWTELIFQQSRRGQGRQALQTYKEMREAGVKPNSYTFVAALKACSSLQELKKVHAEAVESGVESVVNVGNTLVDVYLKFGSLVDARHVFEKMPHRNVVSWTTMIMGHAQRKDGEEGLRLYRRMQEECIIPNDRTFVSALKACSSLLASEESTEVGKTRQRGLCLEECMRIHRDIKRSGVILGSHLGAMLVDVYAKCGSLGDARSVLEMIVHRDVVCWNAMIMGYARVGEGEEALKLYARMQREGVAPNARTFVGALKACICWDGLDGSNGLAKKSCLGQVKSIHTDAVRNGADLDIFVGNMLVDVYAKCGSLLDARSVFEKMPNRDVVSWNTMILGYAEMESSEEALLLYRRMQQEGFAADDLTFVSALKACSSLAGLEGMSSRGESQCLVHVKAILSDIVQSRLDSVLVCNSLVNVYAKCGRLVDARTVFEKMRRRDVVSWSAMILGYAQLDEGEEALKLFTRMQQEGVVPNDRTFVGALEACRSLVTRADDKATQKALKYQCLQKVRAIHLLTVKHGCELNTSVGNMLVDMYGRCGSLVEASCLFEKMPHRDVMSWNAMLSGCAHEEKGEQALQFYSRMQQEGMVPNEWTFVSVLKACCSHVALEKGSGVAETLQRKRCLEQVRALHSDVAQRGFESDVFVGTMLVDSYSRCGSLVDARRVFEKVPRKDVVAWNALIWGYAQMEESDMALHFYARMLHEGVKPDTGTYVGALKACGHVAALEKGKEIHAHISSDISLATSDLCVPTSLIDMYGKCGSMEYAQKVFDSLPSSDVFTWSALIAGYSQLGESEMVFHLFQKMEQEGVKADGITFLSILKVCSHVGRVDMGEKFFDVMCSDYGITPTTDHYVCLIDLLGRSGQLVKAVATAKALEPNGVVWKTVLGACRKWSNVELGIEAFENAIRLDEKDAAAYVLMSNIFAAANRPEDAIKIRAMRRSTGAWKKPGQSWWIDLNGAVHTFVAGEREHPEIREIDVKELSEQDTYRIWSPC